MVQPVRNVSLYAGVKIDYVSGVGLKISRSTHTPFVVFEKKRLAADNKAVFHTTETIIPSSLAAAVYDEEEKLLSAPLAIVVEVMCLKDPEKKETATLSTLYTFLDLPEAVLKYDGAAGKTEKMQARIARQFLQIGAEVYVLDDVFDLGAEDDDDEEDEDADLCVICMFNQKDTTILPCRHMCTCYECAGQLRLGTNRCPICRSEIERVITL
ncbi:hypothetical protein AGDE_10566 [Angomonas deanei]|nr:hypothetical protein AGDE_10566 [Angomonas deanei]|eukprot:EPY28069.1 hypothetical protein AGDE_10566 [Angomonas deanei]